MRLLIKQRVFSWTDSYDVYDENENAKYFVKAEFFSLGHQSSRFRVRIKAAFNSDRKCNGPPKNAT